MRIFLADVNNNCIINKLPNDDALLVFEHYELLKSFYFITGERLIQYASENLVTEILIHPQSNTFIQCMRNLLSSFTRHRHIIHAGYTFTGNGSWILQVSSQRN